MRSALEVWAGRHRRSPGQPARVRAVARSGSDDLLQLQTGRLLRGAWSTGCPRVRIAASRPGVGVLAHRRPPVRPDRRAPAPRPDLRPALRYVSRRRGRCRRGWGGSHRAAGCDDTTGGAATSPRPDRQPNPWCDNRFRSPACLPSRRRRRPRPGQENAWQCRVSHVDGRHWDVVAVRGPGGDDLPESCGKAPVPTWQWSVVSGFGR